MTELGGIVLGEASCPTAAAPEAPRVQSRPITHPKSPWTSDKVETLKLLWSRGYSASQIAKELGNPFNRNSVLGKVNRLDIHLLSPMGHGNTAPRTPRNCALCSNVFFGRADRRYCSKVCRAKSRSLINGASRARTAAERKSVPWNKIDVEAMAREDAAIPVEQRKSFLELKECDCRWPVGEVGTSDFFFCGAVKRAASSYCETHYIRSTGKICLP